MDSPRQTVRRSSTSNRLSENAVDLSSFRLEEPTDFQVSVRMPPQSEGRSTGDRESTEEFLAASRERQVRATERLWESARDRVLELTQPIAVPDATPAALPQPAETALGLVVPEFWPEVEADLAGKQEPGRTIAAGDVLAGRYVIIDKVDHCGMGLVYKALDRHRERAGSPIPWVALKFARHAAEETSTFLRQEFLKLSQLNHPNVVRVIDFARDRGMDFIVMEWLSGETLASMLARIDTRRIALGKAIDIVRSVARGLAHAHDLGIVHGDVKPSNIFVTESRTVKVLDFGSSGKTTSDIDGDIERYWATRAYASCEVLQGQPPEPHDDVFALGVTAYCLLSGERPFGNVDAPAARERDLSPAPLPYDSHEWWAAVAHALEFDAIERPGNARVFLQEFDEAAIEPVAPAATVPTPAVAYGALAATLLASLVWWSVQGVGGLPPDAQTALENGNDALAEGRLVEPGTNSAFEYYSEVLTVAPDNSQALEGLDKIAEQYLTRSREAIRSNDAEAALADLAVAKKISPEHFGIAVIEDLIARHGRDFLVDARQTAATDLERAGRLLLRAESLLPAGDPEVARVRAQLSQQKIADEIDTLLEGVDDRILSERLTIPAGDSAVDLLRKARELAPDDRKVRLAADRIMTALLFQSMFSISNGDLDDAERYIAAAKAMGVKHLALARAEYELAKARRQALSARTS